MNKKTVLFDIDYTLFDTDKFRDLTYPKLMKLLQQEDIPPYHKQVKAIEMQLIKQGGYEPVLFAKTLADLLQFKPQHDEIEKLFYDKQIYDSCLYPEVKKVIEALSARDDLILGIVSQGEETFQERKISAIRKYFLDEDVFISRNKLYTIRSIVEKYKGDMVYIVDDSVQFLDAVKKKDSSVFVILVGKENRYEKREVPANFVPNMRIIHLEQIHEVI